MKQLTRLRDWQLRLEDFALARARMPFAWGRNDCAVFAADAVEAMTGVHLLPNMRRYARARDALVLIEQAGGLRSIAVHALGGFIQPAYARIGDVVLHRVGRRDALGICNGDNILAPGQHGMVAVPMKDATTAWRVG